MCSAHAGEPAKGGGSSSTRRRTNTNASSSSASPRPRPPPPPRRFSAHPLHPTSCLRSVAQALAKKLSSPIRVSTLLCPLLLVLFVFLVFLSHYLLLANPISLSSPERGSFPLDHDGTHPTPLSSPLLSSLTPHSSRVQAHHALLPALHQGPPWHKRLRMPLPLKGIPLLPNGSVRAPATLSLVPSLLQARAPNLVTPTCQPLSTRSLDLDTQGSPHSSSLVMIRNICPVNRRPPALAASPLFFVAPPRLRPHSVHPCPK